MRNPFSASHHVDTDHMQAELRDAYSEQGWGTTVVRNVPQPVGDPFAFQFQLPDDERLLEMSELTDAVSAGASTDAESARAWVRDQGVSLTAAAKVPGVILVGALCRADLSEVFATLTAFAGPHAGPLQLEKGSVTADGAKVATHGVWEDRSYGRIDDIVLVYPREGEEPAWMSIHHVVIQAVGGKLSLTFASTHDGMAGPTGLHYVQEIAKSLWYGPADRPDLQRGDSPA